MKVLFMDSKEQQKINEQFLMAVNIGDIDAAIEAIEAGASIHAVTGAGDNAITLAALKKQREMFEWLLDIQQSGKKIDLNTINFSGSNIVYELVKDGDSSQYLEKVLEAGALPDIPVHTGTTPLMRACIDKNTEDARLLLQYGADVHATILKSDVTPFLLAIQSADFEMAKLLLQKDQSIINKLDSFGNNALVNLLMKSTMYMKRKQKEERIQLCEFLIDNGIDINHSNSTGLCAFWAASLSNEEAVIKKLLDKNVNVDVWNMEMQNGKISAFHYFCMRGNLEIIDELVSRGAQFNKADDLGNLPEAYLFLNPDNREYLLNRNDVNLNTDFIQLDKKGSLIKMPLISLAIAEGDSQIETVKGLIQKGVDITFENRGSEYEKMEPILMAVTSSSYNIAEALLSAGKINLNRLLKISDSSEERMTPLTCLVSDLNSKKMQHSLQVVKLLERDIANAKKKDSNGQEIQVISDEELKEKEERLKQFKEAHEISHNKKIEMIKLLIKNGADVNFVDNQGVPALFYSKKPEFANILKSSGANMLLKDNDGDNALIAAIKMANKEMISYFKEEFAQHYPEELAKVFYDISFSRIGGHSSSAAIEQGILEFIGEENKKAYLESRVDYIYNKKMNEYKKSLKEEEEQATEKRTNDQIKELLETHAEQFIEEAKEIHSKFSMKLDFVDYQDEDGNTPMLVACANNIPFIINLLHDFGAKIDTSNNAGETPLMHAIASDNHLVVEFLLKNGADAHATTKDGKTVLDFAKECSNKVILEQIYNATGLNIAEGGLSGTKRVKP